MATAVMMLLNFRYNYLVQHEKLEKIFQLEENPFEEEQHSFSTPDFRSVKISYIDKLFQKVQESLKALFNSYASFELGWTRFYQLLRCEKNL